MDKKILLVADDDEMNRHIISKFLKNDYLVLEAADGSQAMRLLTSTPVDLLLLDILMPEMDGLEVLREMKNHPELDDIGVVVATSTKEKTERTALNLGADDIVSKPYDPVVIKKRLYNVLAMKSQGRALRLQTDNDTAALLARQHTAQARHEQEIAVEILRCTGLIAANRDNDALVSAMLAEIEQQAGRLNTAAGQQQ